MKILFVMTRAFNPNAAGVQRTTFKSGKYFVEQGLEVAYLSTKVSGHTEVQFGELFHFREQEEFNNKQNIQYFEKVLFRWKPDVVINQMPYVKKLRSLLFANKYKCGYTLLGCLHNSLFNFYSNLRHKLQASLPNYMFNLVDHKIGLGAVQYYHRIKHGRVLKQILDSHDHYVLLSPQNKDELAYFVGDYKADKLEVIPNSIPETIPSAIDHKEKILLSVGRLDTVQKRADLFLPIWEQIAPTLRKWKFIIVGHGEYSKVLQQEIENKKIPNVCLAGYQIPEPYYKKASIFLMTSAYEGFPNTILEAHSHACPVVAFNTYAALSWIVNDQKDAKLISPYDVEAFAKVVVELARNDKERQAMQVAALENANRFTIDKVGQMWLELFNRISKNKIR